eukprot:4478447-Pyramimonas_sp.AAC.2
MHRYMTDLARWVDSCLGLQHRQRCSTGDAGVLGMNPPNGQGPQSVAGGLHARVPQVSMHPLQHAIRRNFSGAKLLGSIGNLK